MTRGGVKLNLSSASVSLVTRLIMNDLKSYIEDKNEYLSTKFRNDIDYWFEWAIDDKASNEEKEAILEEVHDGLQYMDIWSYESTDRQDTINKIKTYFQQMYKDCESAILFSNLVTDYYIEELKYN